MKPMKLRLKNFIGIKSGLGRDEIEIDFKNILKGNQLVAIVGENGSGKSTILDNLSPYRVMVSRATGYSSGSFSFFDQIYGSHAEKDLEWEHEGEKYKSSFVFKNSGKTKKQEAYLFVLNNDKWQPVSTDTNIISDGKASTYDDCINSVVGSCEMFYTAVFSGQNKRSLSSYGNSEIKGLMTELLGLDHIKELGNQSSEVTKLLKFNLKGMQFELSEIHVKEAEIKEIKSLLNNSNVSTGTAEEVRRLSRIKLQDVTKKLAEVQANNNANLEVEQKRTELQYTINGLSQKRNSIGREFDVDIKSANDRTMSIEREYFKEVDYQGKNIKLLGEQLENQNTLLSRTDDVERAMILAVELDKEVLNLSKSLSASKLELEELSVLKNKATALKEKQTSLANNGRNCASKLADVKKRGELVKTVPCADMDINSQCPLLDNANEAAKQIPVFTNEDVENRRKYTETNVELEIINKQIEELGDVKGRCLDVDGEISVLREKVSDNNQVIALKESIHNARSVISSLDNQIAEQDKRKEEQKTNFDSSIKESNQQVSTLQSRKENELGLISKELQQVQDKLFQLPPPSDTSAVDMANNELSKADKELSDAERRLEDLRAQAAGYQANINALNNVLEGSESKKILADKIEQEISYWIKLTAAFGNNGIIALSIDDAGPSLSSLANDLLMSAYGPRFSVSIRTQVEKNDGDMKETFDVIVFDAESGDEKSVSIMSGGEKIYINEALIRAIALYNTEISGRKYGCLFADESDGALDPEKKVQFVRMKRKMLELGGYDHEIFISHTPELWEMADVKIDMSEFRIN